MAKAKARLKQAQGLGKQGLRYVYVLYVFCIL